MKTFFTQRVINMWNSLPQTVVSASTVSILAQTKIWWVLWYGHWPCIGCGYVLRPGAWTLFLTLYVMYIHSVIIIITKQAGKKTDSLLTGQLTPHMAWPWLAMWRVTPINKCGTCKTRWLLFTSNPQQHCMWSSATFLVSYKQHAENWRVKYEWLIRIKYLRVRIRR